MSCRVADQRAAHPAVERLQCRAENLCVATWATTARWKWLGTRRFKWPEVQAQDMISRRASAKILKLKNHANRQKRPENCQEYFRNLFLDIGLCNLRVCGVEAFGRRVGEGAGRIVWPRSGRAGRSVLSGSGDDQRAHGERARSGPRGQLNNPAAASAAGGLFRRPTSTNREGWVARPAKPRFTPLKGRSQADFFAFQVIQSPSNGEVGGAMGVWSETVLAWNV